MSSRFLHLRKTLKLTQKQFATHLCVSNALISAIELGTKTPSEILMELLVYKFKVNKDWLFHGTGEMFLVEPKKVLINPSLSSKAMVAAAVVGPVMPQVTLGIVASVGVANIIQKMIGAYGAKNTSELAKKYLNVSNATIHNWKEKQIIPEKYLQLASQETGMPIEFLVSDDIYLTMKKKDYVRFIQSLKDPAKFIQIDYDKQRMIIDEFVKKL